MTEPTTTETVAPVTNLRASRKEAAAKRPARKPAAKSVSIKAPAKSTEPVAAKATKAAPSKAAKAPSGPRIDEVTPKVMASISAAVAAPQDARKVKALAAELMTALKTYAVPTLNIKTGVTRPVLVDLQSGSTEALAAWVARRASADSSIIKVPGAFVTYAQGKATNPKLTQALKGETTKAGGGFYLKLALSTTYNEELRSMAEAARADRSVAPEVKVAAAILLRRL